MYTHTLTQYMLAHSLTQTLTIHICIHIPTHSTYTNTLSLTHSLYIHTHTHTGIELRSFTLTPPLHPDLPPPAWSLSTIVTATGSSRSPRRSALSSTRIYSCGSCREREAKNNIFKALKNQTVAVISRLLLLLVLLHLLLLAVMVMTRPLTQQD